MDGMGNGTKCFVEARVEHRLPKHLSSWPSSRQSLIPEGGDTLSSRIDSGHLSTCARDSNSSIPNNNHHRGQRLRLTRVSLDWVLDSSSGDVVLN